VNTEKLQHNVRQNMVCLRYVVVNIVHKGDDRDDDSDDDDDDDDDDNNNNNNNNNNCRLKA
jgi:hypothetical protein